MTYKKLPEHNSDNYLKTILESMEYYNSYERHDIATLLYEGYKHAKTLQNASASQKAIVLELNAKWIQILEDLAILCLMFAGTDIKYQNKQLVKTGTLPFEVYAFVDNQTILKFYTIAKRGLGKRVVAKIYGYKTPEQLLKDNSISSKEYPYFKTEMDKLFIAAKDNLNKIGALYSARKKNKGKFDLTFPKSSAD